MWCGGVTGDPHGLPGGRGLPTQEHCGHAALTVPESAKKAQRQSPQEGNSSCPRPAHFLLCSPDVTKVKRGHISKQSKTVFLFVFAILFLNITSKP